MCACAVMGEAVKDVERAIDDIGRTLGNMFSIFGSDKEPKKMWALKDSFDDELYTVRHSDLGYHNYFKWKSESSDPARNAYGEVTWWWQVPTDFGGRYEPRDRSAYAKVLSENQDLSGTTFCDINGNGCYRAGDVGVVKIYRDVPDSDGTLYKHDLDGTTSYFTWTSFESHGVMRYYEKVYDMHYTYRLSSRPLRTISLRHNGGMLQQLVSGAWVDHGTVMLVNGMLLEKGREPVAVTPTDILIPTGWYSLEEDCYSDLYDDRSRIDSIFYWKPHPIPEEGAGLGTLQGVDDTEKMSISISTSIATKCDGDGYSVRCVVLHNGLGAGDPSWSGLWKRHMLSTNPSNSQLFLIKDFTSNCPKTHGPYNVAVTLKESEGYAGLLGWSISDPDQKLDIDVLRHLRRGQGDSRGLSHTFPLPSGTYELDVGGSAGGPRNSARVSLDVNGEKIIDEYPIGVLNTEGRYTHYHLKFRLCSSNPVTPEPTVKQPDSMFKELTPDWFRSFHDTPQTWGFFGPFSMNTDGEEVGALVFSSDLITSLQSDIDNSLQYHYQNHMGDRDSLLIRVTDLLNDKYLAVPVVENASYRSDSACFDYEVKELRVYLNSRNIWDYEIVGTIRDPQDPSTKMSTMLDCSLKDNVYTVMQHDIPDETWKKCNNLQYDFVYSDWGDCTKSCGTGSQTRDATCHLRDPSDVSLNVPVDDRFCTQTKDTTRSCNTQPCLTYTYKYGEWSECSEPCGPGTQTRSVWCEDSKGSIADNSLCSEGMPSTVQACNKGSCMYRTGSWSTCSADCGGGIQARTVQCVDPNGSPVENFLCTSQMTPSATQECNDSPCMSYEYKAGTWSECSTSNGQCGTGTQTRKVECIDQNAHSAEGCQGDRPEDSRDCDISCEASCKSDAITDKRLWYIWTTKDGQKRYLSVDDDSLALTDKRPRHGWIVSRHDKNEDAVRIQLHTDVTTKHSLHFEKKSLKASTKVHAIYIHKLTHHDTQSTQYQFSAHGNGCKTPEEYTFDGLTNPIWTFERSVRGTDKRFHPISILIPLNWDEWVFWLALAGIIIAVVWVLFVLLSIASYAVMGSEKKEGENRTSKYEDMTEFKKDIDKKLENIIDKLPR